MATQIPSYFLTIEEKHLNVLRENLLNNMTVPAKLKIGNTTNWVNISYRGAYTRKFRKRSYQINFNDMNNILKARTIHINAEYRDPSLIRNKLSLDFFQNLGVLTPDTEFINLYRNGEFKGVYLQLESVDDLFLEKRKLPIGPIYYAENNDANFSFTRNEKPKQSLLSGYRQVIGTPLDNHFLREFITLINTTSSSQFTKKISEHLNIPQYFSWLSGAVCTMNNDGFTHNYSLYRNSVTSLFEILPWDYDATWGRKVNGGIMDHTYVPIEGKPGNKLNDFLLQQAYFRKIYKEKLEEILETIFTVDYMEKRVLALHKLVRPHLTLDPYKKKKMDLFDQEPEFILQFIRKRNEYLKNELRYLSK